MIRIELGAPAEGQIIGGCDQGRNSLTIWVWISLVVLVLAILALDLGVLHRKTRAVTFSEAAAWTTTWVILALRFNVGVYRLYEHRTGHGAAMTEG